MYYFAPDLIIGHKLVVTLPVFICVPINDSHGLLGKSTNPYNELLREGIQGWGITTLVCHSTQDLNE